MTPPPRRISEMTQQMIKACCLKCTLKQPKRDGDIDPSTGDFWAYGKTEATKKYVKAAKDDLRLRSLHLKTATDKFHGDFGRVQIGGKMFSWYPFPAMLVRDDFGDWCERNIFKVWDFQRGCERLPDRDESGVEAEGAETLKAAFAEARRRAYSMIPVIDFIEPVCRNSVYDMKKKCAEYKNDIDLVEKRTGKCYVVTKMMFELLSSVINYREKNYALAVDYMLDVAASALKAAQTVQEKAAAEKGAES